MSTTTASLEGTCLEITLDNLTTFPAGRGVLTCIWCEMCAGTCPYGEVMDYPRRR